MRHNIKIYEEMNTDDSRRFYPAHFPVATIEPLKTNFIILESPEDIRRGLLSLVSFNEGDLIAQCMGVALPFQTLHTLRQSDGHYIHDTFFAGYLLHSCDFNARLDMSDFTLHAVKQIMPFELITIFYPATEAVLYQNFDCSCGSENCIKYVTGYSERE